MKSLFTILALLSSVSLFAQTQAVGVWYNDEKDAKIEIYKCGNKLCGKIIWIKNANDEKGNPRLDTKNPEVKLQSRKIQGMVMMENFEYGSNNEWDGGKIYDPKSGKTYACKMTLKNAQTLEVRGYVGISLFGRTATWTKAE